MPWDCLTWLHSPTRKNLWPLIPVVKGWHLQDSTLVYRLYWISIIMNNMFTSLVPRPLPVFQCSTGGPGTRLYMRQNSNYRTWVSATNVTLPAHAHHVFHYRVPIALARSNMHAFSLWLFFCFFLSQAEAMVLIWRIYDVVKSHAGVYQGLLFFSVEHWKTGHGLGTRLYTWLLHLKLRYLQTFWHRLIDRTL